MRIAIAISEVEGLVKTGGLADVGRALSSAFVEQGHEVSLFVPYYQALNGLDVLSDLRTIPVEEPLFSHSQVYQFDIKQTTWQGITLYLIDYPEYFDRIGLYGDQYHAYEDNGERFSFFAGAVLHSLYHMQIQPDIVHCHDWHTAVLPFLLKTDPSDFFANTRSVITIHNAAFQGVVPLDLVPYLRHHPNILSQVHGGYINMLKLGLLFADKVTTVSPNYAKELLTTLGSHGLNEVLESRQKDLIGILNGCDYQSWNPATDPFIAATYSFDDMSGKDACKQDLQRCFELPTKADTPIIGMVCRLTDQKGFSYLLPALPHLMHHNVQIIIAGTGDPAVCMELNTLAELHPDKFAFFNGFSNEMAHKIEAGSDFFLMPSQFEPCGLNQMYSLAYGTLPIVRSVGGLKDTVSDIHDQSRPATGLVFDSPTVADLLACSRRALLFYHEAPEQLADVKQHAMQTRFTWEQATQAYTQLFEQML